MHTQAHIHGCCSFLCDDSMKIHKLVHNLLSNRLQQFVLLLDGECCGILQCTTSSSFSISSTSSTCGYDVCSCDYFHSHHQNLHVFSGSSCTNSCQLVPPKLMRWKQSMCTISLSSVPGTGTITFFHWWGTYCCRLSMMLTVSSSLFSLFELDSWRN